MLDEESHKRCVVDLAKALCSQNDADSTGSRSSSTPPECVREHRLAGDISPAETISGANTAASSEANLLEVPQHFTQKFFRVLVEHVVSTETVEEVFSSVLDVIIKILQEQTIGHFLTKSTAYSSPIL